MTPDDAYAALETHFLAKAGITRSVKRGFAEGGLMTAGKLFAVPHRGDQLLLKLPAGRIQALVATGKGAAFAMGQSTGGKDGGRVMKEWVLAQPEAADEWLDLATEAEAFVREQAAG
jgi:hypothetical protein